MNSLLEAHNDKIKLRITDGHNYPAHFHKELEMIFVLEGYNTASCNGITYDMHAGTVFLAAPNAIHAYDNPPERKCKTLLLILNPDILIGNASLFNDMAPTHPIWIDHQKKSIVWSMIEYAYANIDFINYDSFVMLISTIITIILEDMKLNPVKQKIRLEQKILSYCQQHYTEPIAASQLAAEFDVSEGHISHIFSYVLKTSFPNYINRLRLDHALNLLNHTDLPIIDVATESGFPTLRTFNRVFSSKYHFTPSQFKKIKYDNTYIEVDQ